MSSSDFRADLERYRVGASIQWLEVSLWAVAIYRLGQWAQTLRAPWLRRIATTVHLPLHMVVTVLSGIHLPRTARIGGGLRIWHFGGVILNPLTIIGKNATLRQNVCIGNRHAADDVPVLGDNVDVGVGAVILGRVRIGNNAKIGANAVVLTDVPDGATAVGVPAVVQGREAEAQPAREF